METRYNYERIPIPKTKPVDLEKIRFITLTSPLAKIFEKIILKKTSDLFYSSYGNAQHGFRKHASTTTALIELTHSFLSHYDDKNVFCIAVANFDLSQAFDKVDHDLLVKRLHECAFPTGLIKLLYSYLCNRSSRIKLRTGISGPIRVTQGVPQGSVLGPLLFCVYTSDFYPKWESTTLIKYADDLNLIIPFHTKNPDAINQRIAEELAHLESWCTRKKLHLNLTKSNVMFYSRQALGITANPLPLPVVDVVKVLGVQLNKDLNWNAHCEVVCKKANQRFHYLRRLKQLTTPEELHQIYAACIRSLPEYACPVFVGLNKKLENALKRIDKRAHRIIYGCYQAALCGCTENTLSQRREEISKKLFREIRLNSHHLLHSYLPPIHKHTKHNRIQFCRTSKFLRSFFPQVSILLNSEKQT